MKNLLGILGLLCIGCVFARAVFAQVDGAGWTLQIINPIADVQKPWNVPLSQRFTSGAGVYHTWVYNTDQPFSEGDTTKPRTELRLPDYTSGQWQFSAQMMVPSDTSNWCIFQIHTGDAQSPTYGSTTGMLFFEASNGGSIHWYDSTELAGHLYNTWFQLNVVHDLDNHTQYYYVNNKLIYTAADNGATDFYFKCGDYGQTGFSHEGENNIKNVKIWYQP